MAMRLRPVSVAGALLPLLLLAAAADGAAELRLRAGGEPAQQLATDSGACPLGAPRAAVERPAGARGTARRRVTIRLCMRREAGAIATARVAAGSSTHGRLALARRAGAW